MNDNTCGHECCSPDLEDGCTVDKCIDHPHVDVDRWRLPDGRVARGHGGLRPDAVLLEHVHTAACVGLIDFPNCGAE